MAPLRIAVLECDTPVDKINAKYNGYWGVFSSLLRASAKALDQPGRLDPESGLDITRWDVVTAQEYPKLEDVDALLLTGSSEYFPFGFRLSIAWRPPLPGQYKLTCPQNITRSTTIPGSSGLSSTRNPLCRTLASSSSGSASVIRSLGVHWT